MTNSDLTWNLDVPSAISVDSINWAVTPIPPPEFDTEALLIGYFIKEMNSPFKPDIYSLSHVYNSERDEYNFIVTGQGNSIIFQVFHAYTGNNWIECLAHYVAKSPRLAIPVVGLFEINLDSVRTTLNQWFYEPRIGDLYE